MARQLKTNLEIDAFINRVIVEANHHSPRVVQIIMPLSREVRNRLILPQDRVEVYERLGQLARTCWVTIGGKRFAFSYNYYDKKIDLRDRTIQGQLIFQFDNQTTAADIGRVVANL